MWRQAKRSGGDYKLVFEELADKVFLFRFLDLINSLTRAILQENR